MQCTRASAHPAEQARPDVHSTIQLRYLGRHPRFRAGGDVERPGKSWIRRSLSKQGWWWWFGGMGLGMGTGLKEVKRVFYAVDGMIEGG